MWGRPDGLLEGLVDRLRSEDGQTFVEYALLVVFIAAVVALGAALVGASISSIFVSVADML